MITARQKILAHLRKTYASSAREVARALKMSAPNVRYHLSVLQSDGRAELRAVKNRGGRGRPEKLYSLSQAALGDNLSALADALLAVSRSRLNAAAVAGNILDAGQFAGLAVTKRLVLLVERLGEMHYHPRWEASAEGPRVIFGRCPYARIIEGHPEICRIDEAMLQSALGWPVARIPKNEVPGKGLCPFIFRVG